MYESTKRAIAKYKQDKIERCVLDVPKGTKEVWKAYAESKGMPLATFIKKFMAEAMEADGFTYEIPEEISE